MVCMVQQVINVDATEKAKASVEGGKVSSEGCVPWKHTNGLRELEESNRRWHNIASLDPSTYHGSFKKKKRKEK